MSMLTLALSNTHTHTHTHGHTCIHTYIKGALYNLCVSYFNERCALLLLNSSIEQRKISKGCPQGSASGPGFWNLQYNSLLNLEYTKNTKVIAYADDLMILTKGKTQVEVENYANIETQKVAMWARDNKIIFNDQKSKLMILTRRKSKIKRDFKIYLNNKNYNKKIQ